MDRKLLIAGAAALMLGACQASEDGNNAAAGSDVPGVAPSEGQPTTTKGAAAPTLAAAAAQTAELSTLLRALRAAGLEQTLAGPGPYTLFAPADAAFGKVPAAEVEAMMQPDRKAQLTSVITHHLVPGTVTAADLGRAVDAGKGKAQLATLGGTNLTVTKQGDSLVVADAKGGKGTITRADVTASNGVIHMIDGVLAPQ